MKKVTGHSNGCACPAKPLYFCTPPQASTLLSEGRLLILFVRHGLTDWNKEMRLQGRANIPLNDEGHAQATELAELFAELTSNICIKEIFTSTLERAKSTADYMAMRLFEREPVIMDELIERDYSELEGLTMDERKEKYQSPGSYPSDIESVISAAQRMKRVALDIYKTTGQKGCVVAVTHGGVMNALFSYITRGRAGNCKNISQNCSIAAVASGSADIIPLAFNLTGAALKNYISEIYKK